jgi:hypothetical protein
MADADDGRARYLSSVIVTLSYGQRFSKSVGNTMLTGIFEAVENLVVVSQSLHSRCTVFTI